MVSLTKIAPETNYRKPILTSKPQSGISRRKEKEAANSAYTTENTSSHHHLTTEAVRTISSARARKSIKNIEQTTLTIKRSIGKATLHKAMTHGIPWLRKPTYPQNNNTRQLRNHCYKLIPLYSNYG